jgi:hypothetical protein
MNVEGGPWMAGAIRDGLRMEAIAADTAGDGDTAPELHGTHRATRYGRPRRPYGRGGQRVLSWGR